MSILGKSRNTNEDTSSWRNRKKWTGETDHSHFLIPYPNTRKIPGSRRLKKSNLGKNRRKRWSSSKEKTNSRKDWNTVNWSTTSSFRRKKKSQRSATNKYPNRIRQMHQFCPKFLKVRKESLTPEPIIISNNKIDHSLQLTTTKNLPALLNSPNNRKNKFNRK
jgi:hypothetical protein